MTHDELKELYPLIFDEASITCGEGWCGILAGVGRNLMLLRQRSGAAIRVLAARERYGCLSLCIECEPEIRAEVSAIKTRAEALSEQICELCGEPGRCGWSCGWCCTLCESCRAKRNAR
jgi:hypothetical protein